MTEETPNKKPRKKRRTKAQIEAEKEKEIELNFGSSYEKEVDELLELDCGVHIEKVKEPTPTPLPEYVPQTGLDKLRKKLSQRKLRDEYYEEARNKK